MIIKILTVFSLIFAISAIYVSGYYLDRINKIVNSENATQLSFGVGTETGTGQSLEKPSALFDVSAEPLFLQDLNIWKIISLVSIATVAIMVIVYVFKYLIK